MQRPLLALVLGLAATHAHAGDVLLVPQAIGTIQAAVDIAKPGDVVLVAPGWYRETVVVATSGITLKGAKATIDGAYLGSCLTVQANMVSLVGLGFANGGLPGGEGGGLDVTGSGVSLVDLSASGCAGFGIRLTGTGKVEDCHVSDCLGAGLVVATPSAMGPLTVLVDNIVEQCGTGLVADRGPFLVDRNLLAHNTGDGISLTMPAGDEPAVPTWVTRNRSLGNGGVGLRANDGVGGIRVIHNNDFLDNGVGIDLVSALAGTVVSKNDVKRNRAGGIVLHGSGLLVDRNRIGRNTLVGLVVFAAPDKADGDSLISNNKLESNGGDGIHLACNGNTVEHNYFKDNKGDGLQVGDGLSANWLIGNVVRASGHDGIDNWGTGTVIFTNTCKDNCGADIAGIGDGGGTVSFSSGGNSVTDGTGLKSLQELELATLP